jgi:hypothetical protein
MTSALRHLAHGPHPRIALEAFTRFRSLVATGLLTEAEAKRIIARSTTCAGVPEDEANQTIARAFAAAKRKT